MINNAKSLAILTTVIIIIVIGCIYFDSKIDKPKITQDELIEQKIKERQQKIKDQLNTYLRFGTGNKPDELEKELEKTRSRKDDTLYISTAGIYLIPIPDSLRHQYVMQTIRDGRFDKWLKELQTIGYEWTGSFGFSPYRYMPFYKNTINANWKYLRWQIGKENMYR